MLIAWAPPNHHCRERPAEESLSLSSLRPIIAPTDSMPVGYGSGNLMPPDSTARPSSAPTAAASASNARSLVRTARAPRHVLVSLARAPADAVHP
jgi:hypothetical protein